MELRDLEEASSSDVERGGFEIIVKALDGTEWRIPVTGASTILDIKRLVKGHPVSSQRLIYLGAIMLRPALLI